MAVLQQFARKTDARQRYRIATTRNRHRCIINYAPTHSLDTLLNKAGILLDRQRHRILNIDTCIVVSQHCHHSVARSNTTENGLQLGCKFIVSGIYQIATKDHKVGIERIYHPDNIATHRLGRGHRAYMQIRKERYAVAVKALGQAGRRYIHSLNLQLLACAYHTDNQHPSNNRAESDADSPLCVIICD